MIFFINVCIECYPKRAGAFRPSEVYESEKMRDSVEKMAVLCFLQGPIDTPRSETKSKK